MFLRWTPPPAENGLTLFADGTASARPRPAIILHAQTAGSLRSGAESLYDVESFAGHIGHAVLPECRMIAPLGRPHGFTDPWITCDPENRASRRTGGRLGAMLAEIVALPESSDRYRDGERSECRNRWAT